MLRNGLPQTHHYDRVSLDPLGLKSSTQLIIGYHWNF